MKKLFEYSCYSNKVKNKNFPLFCHLILFHFPFLNKSEKGERREEGKFEYKNKCRPNFLRKQPGKFDLNKFGFRRKFEFS